MNRRKSLRYIFTAWQVNADIFKVVRNAFLRDINFSLYSAIKNKETKEKSRSNELRIL